jgi:hypothetical protein
MTKLTGKNRDGSNVSFNDKPVKKFLIEFCKKNFNWELMINKQHDGIDLISVNGSCPNVETERGNWIGDFWENENYSLFLLDGNPKIYHQTVNIPYRKNHYWVEGDHYKKNGKFWYTETSHLTNIFARTNYKFDQVILIKPEVIREEKKQWISGKIPNNIHKNEMEYWIGFKKEDVETWNYDEINKIWTLLKINKNEI